MSAFFNPGARFRRMNHNWTDAESHALLPWGVIDHHARGNAMRDEAQVKLGDVLEYSAGIGCGWRHCNTVRNQKDLLTAAYLLRASAARRPSGETFRYRLVRDGRESGTERTGPAWRLLRRVAAACVRSGTERTNGFDGTRHQLSR
jgi:hypothetical protein